MNKTTITTFAAVAAACFAGASAYAGPRHVAPPSKPVKEPLAESCITGDLGVDAVSEYISKGIVHQNQGVVFQSYADLHFRLYKSSGPITSITADVGIWDSFNSHTGGLSRPGSTTSHWYENDFTAGLTFNADKLKISPQFRVYQSPSDAFSNVYTAGLTVAYDDKELLGEFSLHPYVFVELQLVNTNGNGVRAGGGNANGQYYEVGIAPTYTYSGVALSLPIKGGFGSGDFYLGNRGFGFFSVGLDAEYALSTVPECLGKWSVHGGVTWVYLGGDASTTSPSGAAGSGPAFSGGPANTNAQLVFGGGLKVAF
jgi:hypothetical protein